MEIEESIEYKIAQSESDWLKYKTENMGIRESAAKLCNAVRRRVVRNIYTTKRTLQLIKKKQAFHPTYNEKSENIVISLTSTAVRIKYIFPTLYSLSSQTRKPNLIVLWLGENVTYPLAVIKKIESLGIKIEYRKDLGPNTKYHYAFSEYKNDLVITVDDDILYHEDMIEELYSTYLENPDLVIARRMHKIRFNSDKSPAKYRDWLWEYKDAALPSYDLLATGVGGVLYPPSIMALKCWQNTDFINVCPACDDIWLKFCELSQNIKVCPVQDSKFYNDVVNKKTQKNALALENIDKGKNDERIKVCARYFGFSNNLCEKILGEE